MHRDDFTALVRHRLALERGRLHKQAPFNVALTFPSPYRVGMSSLGPLWLYRAIQSEPGMACERVFLPDDAGRAAAVGPVASYESLRPLSGFSMVALTVAYELELGGIVQLLESGGLSALREERDDHDPLVVAGGPLTWANPLPLAPFVDAVVMGEADGVALELLRAERDATSRERALDELAATDHVFVPARHGSRLPELARADPAQLPAFSLLRTPEAELSDMVLVEAVRGCARTCRYCVMRRGDGAPLRVVPAERILACVPDDATRVGLVGGAVSDHPHLAEVVSQLVGRGMAVGLGSLRPERLNDELLGALAAAGHRTLTTAMDGLSQRLRDELDRRVRASQLVEAAQLARRYKMARLKLYLMVGVPSETDDDVDEAARLVVELTRIVPVSLAVSPFCAKRHTPLDGAPFAGIAVVDQRLRRLRRLLRGRAEVRATSARWAWVEHVLAQGTAAHGRAVRDAVRAGGSFQAYREAFAAVDE